MVVIPLLLLAVVGLWGSSALRVADRLVVADLSQAAHLMKPSNEESDAAYKARVSSSPQVASYVDVRAVDRNIERRLAQGKPPSPNAAYSQLQMLSAADTVEVETTAFWMAEPLGRSAWDPTLSGVGVVRRADGSAIVTQWWEQTTDTGAIRMAHLTWVLVRRGGHWVVVDFL
jgi:hypothetical protein